MNKKRQLSTKYDILIVFAVVTIATLISYIIFTLIPTNIINVTITYCIAISVVIRYTNRYWCSFMTSLIFVFCINYFFTYPLNIINFTLPGYPLTFFLMLTMTLILSLFGFRSKRRAELLVERDIQLHEAEKERMKAYLLRAVSHDLRTPLTVIMGNANCLIKNSKLDEAKRTEIAQDIYDDSAWLLNQIENMLSVTRIDDSSGSVIKNLEAIEEVISVAIKKFKVTHPETQFHLELPDEIILVPMDAILINQVIINILNIIVLEQTKEQTINISIVQADNKIGVSFLFHNPYIDELSDQIIRELSSENDQISPDIHRGFYLSISICKTIIKAHNGSICMNTFTTGTKLVFTLPLEERS